jgi:hypothetical protein
MVDSLKDVPVLIKVESMAKSINKDVGYLCWENITQVKPLKKCQNHTQVGITLLSPN